MQITPAMLETLEKALDFIERYMSNEREEKLQAEVEAIIKKAKGL